MTLCRKDAINRYN